MTDKTQNGKTDTDTLISVEQATDADLDRLAPTDPAELSDLDAIFGAPPIKPQPLKHLSGKERDALRREFYRSEHRFDDLKELLLDLRDLSRDGLRDNYHPQIAAAFNNAVSTMLRQYESTFRIYTELRAAI